MDELKIMPYSPEQLLMVQQMALEAAAEAKTEEEAMVVVVITRLLATIDYLVQERVALINDAVELRLKEMAEARVQ